MVSAWYVTKGDKRHGPFSNDGLKDLAATGKIAPDTLIWRDGLPQWIPASRVENLFPAPPTSASSPPEFNAFEPPFESAAAPVADNQLPVVEWQSPGSGKLPHAAGRRPHVGAKDSTERLRWWLLFYAKVNFVISCVIATPALALGVLTIFAGVLGAVSASSSQEERAATMGGLVLGSGLVAGLLEITAALLLFLWMNVFTLACAWGAKVLELLVRNADSR